jgi:hypothetical protein
MVFVCTEPGTSKGPRFLKTFMIVKLPMDSMFDVVVGGNEGFKFWRSFDGWEEFAKFWKNTS